MSEQPSGRFVEGSVLHPVARTIAEWEAALRAHGERSFRATQIFRWIQARGVCEPNLMTDQPAALRLWLAEQGLAPAASLDTVHTAADGTQKLVVRMHDGAGVETVLIPASAAPVHGRGELEDANVAAVDDDEDEEPDETTEPEAGRVRVTQCVSTQVGCAMKCAFCASGVRGLQRHLGPEEIVSQVLLGRSLLGPGQVLRALVFMGMGEPLHNYDATARALRLLTDRAGSALSLRRITVSTVGLVPEIARLGRDFEGKVGLAVSLHAADDQTRSRLVPVNARYPLRALVGALRAYPLAPRRRITIEYALIDGVNDSVADARKLATLLRGLRVKVNLIPVNRVDHADFRPPTAQRVEAFRLAMVGAGYTCLVRTRRGDDISAACGQLVARTNRQ